MNDDSDFLLEHGSRLRQTLIMLEGDDGAFCLIGHDRVGSTDDAEMQVALVRSANSDRHYLLVHDVAPGIGHQFGWRAVNPVELEHLRNRLVGLQRYGEALADVLAQHV